MNHKKNIEKYPFNYLNDPVTAMRAVFFPYLFTSTEPYFPAMSTTYKRNSNFE